MEVKEILMGALSLVLTALTVPVVQLIRTYFPKVNKTWAFFLGPFLALLAAWVTDAPQVFGLPQWAVILAVPVQTWLYEAAKKAGWVGFPEPPQPPSTPA